MLDLFVYLRIITQYMDIKFLNITKENFFSTKLLHKYMPLEYALKTLAERKLWFANPVTWKDPFEKRFIEAEYENGKNGRREFPWKNRVFCICMTQTMTSEAYWNTYNRQQIGIEFRIDKRQMYKELLNVRNEYDIYIGKVEYMKTSDIKKQPLRAIPFENPDPKPGTPEWNARLLLLKRVAYRYEDEIRIILVKKKATQEKGVNLEYQCENTELINSIILDPSLGEYTTRTLKTVFEEQYDFMPYKNSSNKYTKRVMKSQLYAEQKSQKLKI